MPIDWNDKSGHLGQPREAVTHCFEDLFDSDSFARHVRNSNDKKGKNFTGSKIFVHLRILIFGNHAGGNIRCSRNGDFTVHETI